MWFLAWQEWSNLLGQALTTEPDVLSTLATLALVLVIGVAVWRGSKIAMDLIQSNNDYRERQISVQEKTVSTLQQMRENATIQNDLNREQVAMLRSVSEANRGMRDSVDETNTSLQKTHKDVLDVKDALHRGFMDTGSRLDALPEQIAKELKPWLERVDELKKEVQDSKRAAETSVERHEKLQGEIQNMQSMILARFDVAIAASLRAVVPTSNNAENPNTLTTINSEV